MSAVETAGPCWVYVTGFGRSGSTFLGRQLALFADAMVLGEVASADRAMSLPQHHCSCGKLAEECPVWGTLHYPDARRVGRESGKGWGTLLLPKAAVARSVPDPIDLALEDSPLVQGHTLLVDISKTTRNTAGRPYYLYARMGFDVRCVFIFRDWRAVQESDFAKRRRRHQSLSKSARVLSSVKLGLSWSLANFAAMLVELRLPANSCTRVRYEDLAQSPELTVAAVLDSLRIPIQRQEQPHEHLVAGNRMRDQKLSNNSGRPSGRERVTRFERASFLLFGCGGVLVTERLKATDQARSGGSGKDTTLTLTEAPASDPTLMTQDKKR